MATCAVLTVDPNEVCTSETQYVASLDRVQQPDGSSQENGRSYHTYKAGKYLLPNDEEEQDRLNAQHEMLYRLLDNSLAWAPFSDSPRVLDLGTGTGIWALNFARQHPSSVVIGSDLSLIQPQSDLPNCSFHRADAEEDSLVFTESFDYVHLRMMVSCFDNPRKVISKIYQNLKPGGYVEFQDLDIAFRSSDGSTAGTAMERWSLLLEQGLKAVGRDPKIASRYKDLLAEAGFVDIVERQIPLPCSAWPLEPKFKEIGRLYPKCFTASRMEGLCQKLLQGIGLSASEITELTLATETDYGNLKIHGFSSFYVVYGRKPIV